MFRSIGRTRVLLALFLLAPSTAAFAELCLGSCNVRHLGWNNSKDLEAVAAVVEQFDFLAVQELIEPAVPTRCTIRSRSTPVLLGADAPPTPRTQLLRRAQRLYLTHRQGRLPGRCSLLL